MAAAIPYASTSYMAGPSGSSNHYAGPAASTSGTQAPSSSTANLLLTPQIMASYKPAKVFRDHIKPDTSYTSLCFDDKGELLVTAGEDETMQVFNCRTGKHVKQHYSRKYGVHLARFTHKSSTIVYASTKEDDTIRYLSLHDNNFLRYFRGHKRKVTSIEMSPADDTFLSGAADDTVRLWDLRSQTCAGFLNVAGTPSVAYDPSGLIFAVTTNLKSSTLLYDIRKLDVDPFADISINDPVLSRQAWPARTPIYTSVKFSNDGNHMLVGTSSGVHYVYHSFNYNLVARLEGHQGLENVGQQPGTPFAPHAGISGEETSWSPDGRYVLSGSADGRICIWDVLPPPGSEASRNGKMGPDSTLQPLRIIDGHKNSPSRIVKFNHRYGMFVSGGTGELAFWLPDGKSGAAADADGS